MGANNMKPIRSLGQNFLQEPLIARQMVDLSEIGEGDRVWEIGPGKGILTRALLEKGCSLTAFELDSRMLSALSEEFGEALDLRHEDILKVNWEAALAEAPIPVKLAANIPYNITSPLLHLLEKHCQAFSTITLMVQKEVAERICAKPSTKAYGVMTLRLMRIFDTRVLLQVGREHFDPIPEVDSAIILMKPRAVPAEIPNVAKYLRLITMAFAHRRKTLRNNLLGILPREQADLVQERSGIDLQRRGETLSETEFIHLSTFI